MKAFIFMVALLLCIPAFADDAENPHLMLGPDGKPDEAKCNVCHEDDLSLSMGQLETCTLCHSESVHAGAQEHIRLEPARVARLVPPPKEGGTVLPLTDDGGIYCGTCHIFHDPRVSEESVLDQAWAPSGRLAQAVRDALSARLKVTANGEGTSPPAITFGHGTTHLRLPVADGSLCRHCHQYGK